MVRVVLTFIYDKLLNYSPLDWITVCTNYYGDASAWDFGTTVAGTSRLPRNLSVRFLFYRCASISNSYHFKEPFLSVWKWCSSSTADINTFTRVLPSRNPLRAMKKLHAATITRRKTHSLFFFFFFFLCSKSKYILRDPITAPTVANFHCLSSLCLYRFVTIHFFIVSSYAIGCNLNVWWKLLFIFGCSVNLRSFESQHRRPFDWNFQARTFILVILKVESFCTILLFLIRSWY